MTEIGIVLIGEMVAFILLSGCVTGANLGRKKKMETITLQAGKEYKIVVGAPTITQVAAAAPTVPAFKVGDLFQWTESHRTVRGNPTPAGKRAVTKVEADGTIEFVVLSNGRIDRTGQKMLLKDCKSIERNGSVVFARQ